MQSYFSVISCIKWMSRKGWMDGLSIKPHTHAVVCALGWMYLFSGSYWQGKPCFILLTLSVQSVSWGFPWSSWWSHSLENTWQNHMTSGTPAESNSTQKAPVLDYFWLVLTCYNDTIKFSPLALSLHICLNTLILVLLDLFMGGGMVVHTVA